MTDCPDAEKAALAEALDGPGANVPGCDCDRNGDADSPLCEMHKKRFEPLQWETLAFMVVDLEAYAVAARALLADLSPAAKEIARKAQAHDDMVAENERLYDALEQAAADLEGLEDKLFTLTGVRHYASSEARAALAGKEPE